MKHRPRLGKWATAAETCGWVIAVPVVVGMGGRIIVDTYAQDLRWAYAAGALFFIIEPILRCFAGKPPEPEAP